MVILHIVDPTTGLDAFDTLALLVNTMPGTQHVLVLGHYGWSDAAVLAGIPRRVLHWSRALGRWDPTVRQAVRRAIQEIQPSHVHAWGGWSMNALGGFDGPCLASVQLPQSQRQLAILRSAMKQRPWLVLTTSHAAREFLVHAGLARLRLLAVAPGAWTAPHLPPVPRNLRRILGLQPREGPILLLGGWSEPTFRQDHAIWATAIISHLYPEVWGLIRSDPIPRQEWVHPFAGYQSFTHTLKDPQLIAIAPVQYSWRQLAAFADLFVFTPAGPAGMNSLLAALACGKPIVSTATAPVRELLEDGQNALLAAPENPREIAARIHTLLHDDALRQRLSAAAQATFQRYCSGPRLTEQMASIYAQVEQDPALRNPVAPPPL